MEARQICRRIVLVKYRAVEASFYELWKAASQGVKAPFVEESKRQSDAGVYRGQL